MDPFPILLRKMFVSGSIQCCFPVHDFDFFEFGFWSSFVPIPWSISSLKYCSLKIRMILPRRVFINNTLFSFILKHKSFWKIYLAMIKFVCQGQYFQFILKFSFSRNFEKNRKKLQSTKTGLTSTRHMSLLVNRKR